MARKNNNGQLLPWMSARLDCKEKRFLQVGNSLFFSPEFQNLNTGARMLYLCMAIESGGKREVAFSRATAAKYGIPRNSFTRQITDLKEAGFVEVSMESNYWQFAPTVYRFSFLWKEKPHPQNGGR